MIERALRFPFLLLSADDINQTSMKQIYLFCLLALMTLGIAVPSNVSAQCTVTTNIAGAIEVWDGLSNGYYGPPTINKVTGLSYDVPDGLCYIVAAEGYQIIDIQGGDQYLKIRTGESYHLCEGRSYVQLAAGSSDYRGKTIHFEVVKLANIKSENTATVQIENGGTFLQKIWLDVSGTEFQAAKDDMEEIEIEYSDKVDSYLCIAPNNAYPIFSISAFHANNEQFDVDFDDIHGYYKIPLEDGLQVRIKVFENGTPTIGKDTITLEFENQMAKDAMEMIYSRSTLFGGTLYQKGEDAELPASLELEDGAVTTFTWNSQDYNMSIYVDEEKVTAEVISENTMSGTSSWQFDPKGDHTIRFAATERQWGTVSFTFEVENEEGINFREGSIDGPIIDLSKQTLLSESNGVKKYSVQISAKSPKIFIEEKEGWYLLGSYYDTGENQQIDEPTYCMTYYDGALLNDRFVFKGHKISKTSPYVIYLNASTDNMTLKDKHDVLTDADKNPIELTNGYNLIYVDPIYSGTLSIVPYNEASFNIVYDMTQTIGKDSESGSYLNIPCEANGVLYIGTTAPTMRTVSFNIPDNTTKVTYHMVKDHDSSKTSSTLETFHNTLVTIAPRVGCAVYLDGTKLEPKAQTRAFEPALAGHEVSFVVTSANHSVEVKYEGNATETEINPEDGAKLTEITTVVVSFPNAQEVSLATTASAFDYKFTSKDGNTWKGSVTEAKTEDSEVPSYTYTIATSPETSGEYVFTISGGHFTIDGDLANPAISATYTISTGSGIKTEITPEDGTTLPELTYLLITFPEAQEADLAATSTADDIKLESEDGSWKGELTARKAQSTEAPAFKISITNAPTENGNYKLTIPKGFFTVDGQESDPIEATYAIDLASGIGEIISGSLENATIFTIDGRLLVKKADKGTIDSLEKGIYIINGKKVIKK